MTKLTANGSVNGFVFSDRVTVATGYKNVSRFVVQAEGAEGFCFYDIRGEGAEHGVPETEYCDVKEIVGALDRYPVTLTDAQL